MTEKPRELTNNFHIIRLIAAIFVIISHSYPLTGIAERDWMWLATFGNFSFSYIGLSTFFIISGYLITQSAGPEKMMTGKRILAFLWRRILRIFPGILVMVALTVFVLGPLVTNVSLSEYFADGATREYLKTGSLYFIKYALPGVFGDNPYPVAVNGSIWTLSYEFTMYMGVLFFAIFGLLRFRWITLLIWLVALGHFGFLPSHTPPNVWEPLNLDIYAFAKFFLYFLGGMVFYLFKDKILYKWWIFLLVTAVWIGSFVTPYVLMISYVCLPYIIIYLAHLPGRMNGWAKYGDFSYGMYLYAFPVQQTIAHFWPILGLGEITTEYMMPLAIVLTFPFAYLSWKLVEEPALRWKKH